MGKKNPKTIWDSARLNNQTFNDFYTRLKGIALSRFEWINVPDTIDLRYLERTLFEKGFIVYFNDPTIGNLALPANLGGALNFYGIPVERRVYSTNSIYNATLGPNDSVIIWNNYEHLPTEMTTRLYATRLYEIQRAIDVNVKGQKTPKVILAPETQRLSLKNLFMQYDGNEPFIYGDPDLFDKSKIDVIDTSSPYVSDRMTLLKHDLFNEYLTFLGIENSNQDKKERLVSDEVGSNYGAVEAQRNVFLDSRKEACKYINKMFGLNIDVRFKSNLNTMLNNSNLKEGEENGEIYDTNKINN